MNVQIIVDSGTDLPKAYYNELSIEMVPLTVYLNEKDYLDQVDIESKTVYDAMRDGAAPKTAQPSPESFHEVFKKYAEEGKTIIYFGLSSELSGTYQSATIAREQILEEYPNTDIYTIDTKAASMGYGLIAYHAAKLAHEEASVQDILDLANHYVSHMEHIFTVDDLEYLQRGGRVSRTQAFVGSLLKIKPLLHVEEGKLVPLEKIRGAKKVLRRMVDLAKERGEDFKEQTLAITHGDDEENAQKLAELLRDELQPKDIIIYPIGSAIGAHAGPGTIALFFLSKTE